MEQLINKLYFLLLKGNLTKKFEMNSQPLKLTVSTFKVQDLSQPDDSILSKSTTNITNISSLTNQSQNATLNNNNVPSTSDYENLSNLVIDEKFYSTPMSASKRNVYMTHSNNLLQVASPPHHAPRTQIPMPPPTRPPPIPSIDRSNGSMVNIIEC